MVEGGRRERAVEPGDLNRFVVERLNAGDVDGLVELYEPDAVLALPGGGVATGRGEIRAAYEGIVAGRPVFTPGEPQPVLRSGDLALTAVRIAGGDVTVEVARRQPDGTWLWAIDNPSVVGRSTPPATAG
ncbi:nuclear transport factor 2 family protein [Spongiactinospora sp. TRM90649]|uniref:YybH family protein n=1 Tax=Spongiactinospora sp. TRM90649 TaxID=3031114 RepID=UPI0023F68BA3|nr:nuclear transport factor 2 family protein [Spongiactinospora sp. TRM90649]MDF5751509.1 nuclear transport factor 2 family protein [Spongiactinospora sp. TRM90649]